MPWRDDADWDSADLRDKERCPDCNQIVFITFKDGATKVKHNGKVVDIPDHNWVKARRDVDDEDETPNARDVIHGKPDKSGKKLKVKNG